MPFVTPECAPKLFEKVFRYYFKFTHSRADMLNFLKPKNWFFKILFSTKPRVLRKHRLYVCWEAPSFPENFKPEKAQDKRSA